MIQIAYVLMATVRVLLMALELLMLAGILRTGNAGMPAAGGLKPCLSGGARKDT